MSNEDDPHSKAHSAPEAEVTSLDAARRSRANPPPRVAPDDPGDADSHNPLALGLGAVVILALVIGAWFLIQSMRCNPLFSDAGLYHSRACR
ncbi:MAG: hypothetical protein ACLP8A_03420 [Methylovirgula sp.]